MGDAATKRCGDCGVAKPTTEFHRYLKDKPALRSVCKDCSRKRSRRYRLERRERFRHYHLVTHYGLTAEEYDAMVEAQGGVCAVCGGANKRIDPRTGRLRRLSVDHDHQTGKVRGLLCLRCNLSIGQAGEDPRRLRDLARYLEGS